MVIVSGPSTSKNATDIATLRDPLALFESRESVESEVCECGLKLKEGKRLIDDASE